MIEQGKVFEGTTLMVLGLLFLEIWVAFATLGAIMVATLIGMGLSYLYYAAWRAARPLRNPPPLLITTRLLLPIKPTKSVF